jgi:hypothetical protein
MGQNRFWATFRRCKASTILQRVPSESPRSLAAEDFVWIEGEEALRHAMCRHGWYDSVKKDNLSNNEWLSHFAPGSAPMAEFEVAIPESESYHFWIRANSVAGPRRSCLMMLVRPSCVHRRLRPILKRGYAGLPNPDAGGR